VVAKVVEARVGEVTAVVERVVEAQVVVARVVEEQVGEAMAGVRVARVVAAAADRSCTQNLRG
jgi:hypothetical protein